MSCQNQISELLCHLHPEEDEDSSNYATITTTTQRSGYIVSTEERRITLAYEGLIHPPTNILSDYGNIIEILDLSHNSISQLEFLIHFPNLSTLILDHNCISEISTFPPLPQLSTLWLNNNLISNLHPFIPRLGVVCGRLTTLSLMGNEGAPSYLNGGTYYQYLQYRLFVISWLGDLEYLDDRQVTLDQRNEATRLFGPKLIRTVKQLYNPSAVLKRFQTLFNTTFSSFSKGSKNNSTNNANFSSNCEIEDEDDGIYNEFESRNVEGEDVTLEEVGMTGFHSDSDSNSLNNLDLNNYTSLDPDPTFGRKKGRNLVI